MKQNEIYSLLGLAAKAGKIVSGEFAVENAIKSGKAALVIVGSDASDNTKKLFQDKCKFYKISFMEYGEKDQLGHAIGKDVRSSIAVMDFGFAKAIHKKVEASVR
ncbi:MAG: ribosomal L7Ae/L30e/S12e/Gadd45 family protein [Lachnospiraceae bacterium]|nr:ribosomal L7Ae/L30e/S12e/Gadd45 family protein [Lachnospiraceae bacterium]